MEKNRNYFRFCQFALACLITVVGFGQQTVFTLNGLRSTNQYLTLDSTSNLLGVESSGQTHTIRVGKFISLLSQKQGKIDGFPGYDEINNGDVLTSNFGAISWTKVDYDKIINKPIIIINVSNIADSTTITHNLGTQKIDCIFFDLGYKKNDLIDYYPISNNAIVVYLPRRDKPTQKKFTGEIFITKR